jgi:DNA-binding GntR family transcriptional regulator
MSSAIAEPILRRSLHDELIDRLRELMTEGTLKPGAKIPERELCTRFGVSRTPLREALKVLAADGLVILTPNRGASVRPLTMAELDDALPVMSALETLTGELAAAAVTDSEIAYIRELHETMVGHWRNGARQAYFRCNRQIHEAILAATGNATLQSHYRTLAGRMMSARYVADMPPERWRAAIEDHQAILEALAARDGKRLGAILARHLKNKVETIEAWLRQQEGEAAEPA